MRRTGPAALSAAFVVTAALAATDDTWVPIQFSGAPQGRVNHRSVWTGSRMIVWGGAAGSTLLATGGVYDPQTDSWTATATSGAPSARRYFTAVWTGSELIVWGGEGPAAGGYLGDGAAYDPATDQWTPLSSAGAPSARARHAAVWTGAEMIVWGGVDGSEVKGDGARYDPSTDTWLPVSAAAAPAARYGHVGLWAGDRMIVWDGQAATSVTHDGARYDPSTDAWTPMATAGAPTFRSDPGATWTGRVMVLWGGRVNEVDGVDTGGRYDPAADAWSAVAAVGAPSRRHGLSMIWSGGRAVVWGGRNGIASYDNGGRYDPVNDAWSSVSAVGAPFARGGHTAVWTGTEMFVWGGGFSRSDGGRYGVLIDTDADGVLDQDDCAPWDPTAVSQPQDLSGLAVAADKATISWDPASGLGSGTVYDLARGVLAELPAGSGANDTCVAAGTAASTATDFDVPVQGDGHWYVARARNACGAGTYGAATSGLGRAITACP